MKGPARVGPAALRITAAAALGAAATVLLGRGGVNPLPALLVGLAAACFAWWRSVAGVVSSFLLVLTATLLIKRTSGMDLGPVGRAVRWLALLELFGWLTVLAVAALRDERRISRRLLGAWLGSTGLILLGLALGSEARTLAAGGALLSGGVAWKLGIVPVYSWAPMLLRHPDRRIVGCGAVAFVASGALLLTLLPLLPDAAARMVQLLSAATVPWALWHVVRQWRRDRPCARTYGAVTIASALFGVLMALRD